MHYYQDLQLWDQDIQLAIESKSCGFSVIYSSVPLQIMSLSWLGSGFGPMVGDYKCNLKVNSQKRWQVLEPHFSFDVAIDCRLSIIVPESEPWNDINQLSCKHNASSEGLILGDILKLAARFYYSAFNQVRQDGNSVAHSITGLHTFIVGDRVWLKDKPDVSDDLVSKDICRRMSKLGPFLLQIKRKKWSRESKVKCSEVWWTCLEKRQILIVHIWLVTDAKSTWLELNLTSIQASTSQEKPNPTPVFLSWLDYFTPYCTIVSRERRWKYINLLLVYKKRKFFSQ